MTCSFHFNFKNWATINALVPENTAVGDFSDNFLPPAEFVTLLHKMDSTADPQYLDDEINGAGNKKLLCYNFLRFPELYCQEIIADWGNFTACELATDFLALLPLDQKTVDFCFQRITELQEINKTIKNVVQQLNNHHAVIDLYRKIVQINPELLVEKILAGDFDPREAGGMEFINIVRGVLNRYAEKQKAFPPAFFKFLSNYYQTLSDQGVFGLDPILRDKFVRALLEGRKTSRFEYGTINPPKDRLDSEIILEALEHQNSSWAAREIIEAYKKRFVQEIHYKEDPDLVNWLTKNIQKNFPKSILFPLNPPNYLTKQDFQELLGNCNSNEQRTTIHLVYWIQRNVQQKFTAIEKKDFLFRFLNNTALRTTINNNLDSLKYLKLTTPNSSWLDVYQDMENKDPHDIVHLLELSLVTEDDKLLAYCRSQLVSDNETINLFVKDLGAISPEKLLAEYPNHQAAAEIQEIFCQQREMYNRESAAKIKLRKILILAEPSKIHAELRKFFHDPAFNCNPTIEFLSQNQLLLKKNANVFAKVLEPLLKNSVFFQVQTNKNYDYFFKFLLVAQRQNHPSEIEYRESG